MELRPTAVEGCVELRLDPRPDRRGDFLKLFHATTFADLGLAFEVRELFWSRSHEHVVRGLHFQVPPVDVAKLVCCLDGAVLDVVVDLRVGSPTYHEHCAVPLSAEAANAVFVPEGCAHGFLVTEGDALVLYAQSGEFDAEREGGILWSSAGVDWPIDESQGVLSDRDAAFPRLDDFASPFVTPSGTLRRPT
jgi:dTDP-4-dehydrorhamnose 3,5-epimerase